MSAQAPAVSRPQFVKQVQAEPKKEEKKPSAEGEKKEEKSPSKSPGKEAGEEDLVFSLFLLEVLEASCFTILDILL